MAGALDPQPSVLGQRAQPAGQVEAGAALLRQREDGVRVSGDRGRLAPGGAGRPCAGARRGPAPAAACAGRRRGPPRRARRTPPAAARAWRARWPRRPDAVARAASRMQAALAGGVARVLAPGKPPLLAVGGGVRAGERAAAGARAGRSAPASRAARAGRARPPAGRGRSRPGRWRCGRRRPSRPASRPRRSGSRAPRPARCPAGAGGRRTSSGTPRRSQSATQWASSPSAASRSP